MGHNILITHCVYDRFFFTELVWCIWTYSMKPCVQTPPSGTLVWLNCIRQAHLSTEKYSMKFNESKTITYYDYDYDQYNFLLEIKMKIPRRKERQQSKHKSIRPPQRVW